MKLETKIQTVQQPSGSTEEIKKTRSRGKRRIRFDVEAPPGSEVFVAGDFNAWDRQKHRLTDKGHPGHFSRQIYVEPGTIEYKFLVDGEWHIDSDCPSWSPNEFGTLNSVLHVG